jgi:hypothetical protein
MLVGYPLNEAIRFFALKKLLNGADLLNGLLISSDAGDQK